MAFTIQITCLSSVCNDSHFLLDNICFLGVLYVGAPYRAPGPREFASGDYVKVELDEEAFSAAMKSGNSLDTIMVSYTYLITRLG